MQKLVGSLSMKDVGACTRHFTEAALQCRRKSSKSQDEVVVVVVVAVVVVVVVVVSTAKQHNAKLLLVVVVVVVRRDCTWRHNYRVTSAPPSRLSLNEQKCLQ